MPNPDNQTREAALLRQIGERDGGFTYRAAKVSKVDIEARTVELSFSSEAEVARWGWIEVLSHEDGACDLSRLNDGGALLCDHNWSDQRGVVEKAWIDNRKGRAIIKISRSEKGEELLQDVADKIKTKVSVGYRILAVKLFEEREDGDDVYHVTRWEPYEISFVAVPADTTVGTDRAATSAEKTLMADVERAAETLPEAAVSPNDKQPDKVENRMADNTDTVIDAQAERTAGVSAERDRVRAIQDIATKVGKNVEGVDELVRDASANGTSPEAFQAIMLDKLNERASKPLNDQLATSDIGLTQREIGQYSLIKVVRALADPTDRAAQRAAQFEFEASEAAAKNQEKVSERFVIPTDVLRAPMRHIGGTRAFNTSTSNAAAGDTGGYLVATNLLAGSFIDVLRKKATIMRMGRVLGGLVGNVEISKKASASQAYWVNGEDVDATETGMVLGQIALSPKTIAAFTDITRKLLKQSTPDAETLVRMDLAAGMALGIDLAGYYGTAAAGQPRGIANYAGINVVDLATAGKPTWGEIVDMETQVSLDDADVDAMVYVGNASFRGHCKTTEKFANTGVTLWEKGNQVNGYDALITNQIAAGDVFFGNFDDLLIGMWGGLELTVDPYAKSKSGGLRVITFQDVDFALRRVESFCLGRLIP